MGVKAVRKYVNEIDPWGQFHHLFTCSFCSNVPKALKDTDDLTFYLHFLGSASLKAAPKMLLKFLQAAFAPGDLR